MADRIKRIHIEQQHRRILLEYAHASEQEACGILVGSINPDGEAFIDEIRPIINICQLPIIGFEFEPTAYLNAILDTDWFSNDYKYRLLGMWHTHPNYPGYPSSVDHRAAEQGHVIEGAYLIHSTRGDDLYSYYWDGSHFKVLKVT